jgi:hypothetical protein
MAALNFPTTGLYNGLTYTGDNGITYTYQDGKWVGSGVVSSTISYHLHHGDYNLTLNADGTVQFPNYKFPVADGTANQVLKTDGSGVLTWDSHVGPSIGDMVFTGNTMNDVNGIIVQNYGPGQAATAAVILPTHGSVTNPVEINNTTGNVRIGVGPSIVNQWTFGTDSKLTIPGYLITPYGEIRQSSIGDSGMAIDALSSQGVTISSNGTAHKWHFAADGNLTLPTGGAVNYANGHSILEGINSSTGDITFSGSEMSSSTNSIIQLYTNGYSWNFRTDGSLGLPANGKLISDQFTLAVNGRNLIISSASEAPTPDDVHIHAEDPQYGVTVGESSLGSYVTVNGLLNDQTVNIVTQTGGRDTNSTQWYNILANVAISNNQVSYNSSVLLDSQGDVYTIGGYVDGNNNFDSDNLYQKFDTTGNRLWKKTWTTSAGMTCGSINQSARMILGGTYGYPDDTILWTSHSGVTSYIGRMDTDGNFTDGHGNPTNPLRQTEGLYIADLEPTVSNLVYVVGKQSQGGHTYPYMVRLDLNAQVQSKTGVRITNPDEINTSSGYNIIKSIAQDVTLDSLFTAGHYQAQSGNIIGLFSNWSYNGPGHRTSFKIGENKNTDVIVQTVAVNNHAIYLLVPYGSATTVIKLTQIVPGSFTTHWQTRIGTSLPTFGNGLAFDSDNNVYIAGDSTLGGPHYLTLTKLNDSDGSLAWSRSIGSGNNGGEGILFFLYNTDANSSTDIEIRDNLAVMTGYTYDKGSNSGCFTIQYPIDTHPVGTYGDFTIADVSLGRSPDNLSIDPLAVTPQTFNVTVSNETMISTVVTETDGWQETHWDLSSNQEVTDTPTLVTNTWTFGTDGETTLPAGGGVTFSNGTINTVNGGLTARAYNGNFTVHVDETENIYTQPPKIWTFDVDGDLAVPGEVRNRQGYRAVWENEIPGDVAQLVAMLQNMNTSAPDVNWDGGAAATLYDKNTNADGGFSSSRWGRNTTIFDGGAGTGSSYTMTLNGGGA